ncbi:MAG: hypothetical protein ABI383_03280 [Acidobacteriaceae bacterium]
MRYQTLRGIPLAFAFEWPVHPSHSGSDWFVLHGAVTLDNGDTGDNEGSGLHADVSVNISRAVVNALPSLDPKDARSMAINAVRKYLDTRDLLLVKSGKRQPVNASSRVYSIVRNEWTFNNISDDELRLFLERKVYWDCVRGGNPKSWIGDPVEAQYVNSEPERLLSIAQSLASNKDGSIVLEAGLALPTDKLRAKSDEFNQAVATALADLNAKHAYERA